MIWMWELMKGGREWSGIDVTGLTSDCSLFCFHVIIGNELTKLH